MTIKQLYQYCKKKHLDYKKLIRYIENWDFIRAFTKASDEIREDIIEAIRNGDHDSVKEFINNEIQGRTYRELRDTAKELKVKYYASLDKHGLIEAIHAKRLEECSESS